MSISSHRFHGGDCAPSSPTSHPRDEFEHLTFLCEDPQITIGTRIPDADIHEI